MKIKRMLAFLLSFVIIFAGLPTIISSASEATPIGSYYYIYDSTNYTQPCFVDFNLSQRGVVRFTGTRLFDAYGNEQMLSFRVYKMTDLDTPIWSVTKNNFEVSTNNYQRLIPLDAGSYRFLVYPTMYNNVFSSGAQLRFDFYLDFVPIDCYEREGNNDKASANPLKYNTPVLGYADNSEDYYSVNVSKDTIARIKIKNYSKLTGSVYVKFISANNSSQILASYNAAAGKDHYYFDVKLKAGTNYINVTSLSKEQIDYSIEVSNNVVIPTPVIKNLKISGSRVDVNWNQLSGISGYEIWRKVNNGAWKLALNAGSNTIGFYQTGTDFNKTYQFKVKAYKTIDGTKLYSGWSKIKALNPTPTNIKLSAKTFTYDGKVKTPTVKIKNKNGITLKNKVDYTVKYSTGRKQIGKYKATITFKGNYTGKKTVYFEIVPKGTNVSKVTAAKKSLKVYLKKQTKQTSGYQIQYSTSKKFTNAKTAFIKSKNTNSTTLKNLKAKTTYYVRVRTYKTVNGTKYYSKWSVYKTKKTK